MRTSSIAYILAAHLATAATTSFEEYDIDKDGLISRFEFEFAQLDQDHNGNIDRWEFEGIQEGKAFTKKQTWTKPGMLGLEIKQHPEGTEVKDLNDNKLPKELKGMLITKVCSGDTCTDVAASPYEQVTDTIKAAKRPITIKFQSTAAAEIDAKRKVPELAKDISKHNKLADDHVTKLDYYMKRKDLDFLHTKKDTARAMAKKEQAIVEKLETEMGVLCERFKLKGPEFKECDGQAAKDAGRDDEIQKAEKGTTAKMGSI